MSTAAQTAELAAALAKFEPDDAVVALLEMLACQFALAGILPGSPAFEQALVSCRDVLAARTLDMNRAMVPYRHTRH